MQLQRHQDEIDRLDVQVAVVTFQAEWMAAAYAERMHLRWPLLIDEKLKLYHAYSMRHGRLRDILGPAAIGAYLKAMARGRMPRRTAGDPRQLGGNVLVDPAGIVRLHHVATGPAGRPSVERQLDVVRVNAGRRPP